jgi:hypothetical protein
MKIQHLAIAACILLVTASCNSSSTSSASSDTAMNTMSEDTSMSSMTHDSMSMGGDTSMHHMQACVVMVKGKMMLMDSGKTTAMKEIFTTDNGTKVKPNGSYTTADGKTDKLKDNECIMKDGSKTTMDEMPM